MKKVLLSFDVEEFDLPREHGAKITVHEGAEVSAEGLERVLKVLAEEKVKATFFCTGNFAKEQGELVRRLAAEGHEVACHGVEHFTPQPSDVEEAKKIIEKVAGARVTGWRQPRMGKIDYQELRRCGYKYDSSVNPAFIPGRYNNLKVPRRPYWQDGVLEIPTSVATGVRMPMFWLMLHWMPTVMYIKLAERELKRNRYFATYWHPWEFSEIRQCEGVPGYIKHNSGEVLVERLRKVIRGFKKCGGEFVTYDNFADMWYNTEKDKKK